MLYERFGLFFCWYEVTHLNSMFCFVAFRAQMGKAHQVTQPGTFYFILLAHRRHVLRYSPNVNKSWTVVMWGTGDRPLAGFFFLFWLKGEKGGISRSHVLVPFEVWFKRFDFLSICLVLAQVSFFKFKEYFFHGL